ncbi:hypothetical protein PMAYCL1PPCAC_33435, partial [Pristionchus mayeri]
IFQSIPFVNGMAIAVCYGPLLLHLPAYMADTILFAQLVLLTNMWKMLPAPSIIQILTLSQYKLGTFARLTLAYITPITFAVLGYFAFLCHLIPSAELLEKMEESVYKVHG